RDADGTAGHIDDLLNRVGFAIDHDDAIIRTMRIINFIGFWLNLEIVAAFEQQVDLLHDFLRFRVVHDNARHIAILDADIEFATVRVQSHPVRRRTVVERDALKLRASLAAALTAATFTATAFATSLSPGSTASGGGLWSTAVKECGFDFSFLFE